MLINLRNALMTGKRLPYDAEAEYLESTGTQWIDTGYASTATTKLEIDLMFTGSKTQQFGSGRSASGVWAILFGYYQSHIAFWGGVTQLTRSSNYTTNELVTCGFSVPDQTYWIGGNAISDTTIGTPTTTVQTFALFASKNADNTFASPCTMRVYSCKIWDNGVLVRDYIPVRKGTVGYLYDRVSGKLFGNAGTGDFVLGPDVVPVEYIESTGTQYTDLGWIPDLSKDLEITGKAGFNTNRRGCLMGNLKSGVSNGYMTLELYNEYRFRFYSAGDIFVIDTHATVREMFDFSLRYTSADGAANGTVNGYSGSGTVGSAQRILNANSMILGGDYRHVFQYGMFGPIKIKNPTLLSSLRPVRVGTDATSWEGAMMDVLTRRIYRNAGTGAFGYGNDLKYPIPAS